MLKYISLRLKKKDWLLNLMDLLGKLLNIIFKKSNNKDKKRGFIPL